MKKNILINIVLILCVLLVNTSFLTSKVYVGLNKDYQTLNLIYSEHNDENWPPPAYFEHQRFPLRERMAISNGTPLMDTTFWINEGPKSKYVIFFVKKGSFTKGDTIFEEFYVDELSFTNMFKKEKFPKVDFSELTRLVFSGCYFTGGLNNIVVPKLDTLMLSNCMNVDESDLKLDLPNLKDFWVTDKGRTRTIKGLFNNSLLPNLETLELSYQGISSLLLDFQNYSPKIRRLSVSHNKLMPIYLEKLIDAPSLKNGVIFYDWQTPDIPNIIKDERNDSIAFSYQKEKILGEYNIFTWQEFVNNDWFDIKNSPDTLVVSKSAQKKYRMSITNSKLPRYKLYSTPSDSAVELNKCWENDYFKICLPTTGFSESKDGILSAEGNAIFNEFVQIDGKIVIDPAKMNVNIDGKIYLKEVPVISGGIGEILLAEGKYELKLLGSQGKVTNFLNGLAKKIPDVGGLKFKIKDLEFVGGKKPSGIKMTAEVEWKNIRKGCSDEGAEDDEPTKLELSDLEISKEKGWELGGMKLENFGIMPKMVCQRIFSRSR